MPCMFPRPCHLVLILGLLIHLPSCDKSKRGGATVGGTDATESKSPAHKVSQRASPRLGSAPSPGNPSANEQEFDHDPKQEDQALTDRYLRQRNLFDSMLRSRTSQGQIQLLCEQYRGALEKIDEARSRRSPLLGKLIRHEINRTGSLEKGYRADPLRFARIALDSHWMLSESYKEAENDVRSLLGRTALQQSPCQPQLLPTFGDGVRFFDDRYLCPIQEFTKQFEGVKSFRGKRARVPVGMPGFPNKSIFYHAFDGDFFKWGVTGDRYNRMFILTDSWDQVVGVQFTCESPKQVIEGSDSGIGIYNLVQFRRKASPTYKVVASSNLDIDETLRITTMLTDAKGDAKEINVLYLPNPTVSLIQYCLGQPED